MRFHRFMRHGGTLILLACSVIFLQLPYGDMSAEAADSLNAEVAAVQGQAYIVGTEEGEGQPLSLGSTVPPWTTVRTDDDSKLLLLWERGLLTSMGSISTLFMSSRQTQEGPVPDIQLIEGAVRVSTLEGPRGASMPYGLTTPVVTVEPVSFDRDVDFIAEIYEPTATVVTVLKGPVKIRSVSVEDSREMVVDSCQSVYVEQGKPIPDTSPVPSDTLERLIADTTIPGTQIAQVQPCGVERIAQRPQPAPSLPPDYVYIEDDDFVDWYPYEDIQVFPPEAASGPVVIFLPGIGQWYLPYEVYHVWGFGPDVIQVYVTLALAQNSMYYDQYYWNDFAVREREYYDVLYAAQLAGNTHLIAQTQQQLVYLRVRQNLMARRIQNLRARVGSLEKALPRRGPASGTILAALTNSLNSPKNIDVARSFRQRIKNDVQIQSQLAGRATDELVGLRTRLAQARDPRERMQLRQSLSQLRGTIREGKLPLPEKEREVKSLLAQLPKAEKPEQLDRLQNQLVQRLGKPKVMEEPSVTDPRHLNELRQRIEKTAAPEERKQVERRLQDLQKTVQQRNEIETAHERMDEMISRAAKTQDAAKRAELLNQVQQLVKPGVGELKGPLRALREQQRLRSQIVGTQETEKQQALMQRMQELTKQHAGKVPQPSGRPPVELRKRGEVAPTQADRLRKQEEELKGQAEESRRKAEELLKQKQQGASQAERQRLQELDKQARERLQRQRQMDDAKRHAEERAKQAEEKARQAGQAEQLRKQKEKAASEAEARQRQERMLQKQKEDVKQQRLQEERRAREDELRKKPAEQDRARAEERVKVQQRQQELQKQKQKEQKEQEQRAHQQRLQEQRLQEQQRIQQQKAQERQRLQQQRMLDQQRTRVPQKPGTPEQGPISPPLR